MDRAQGGILSVFHLLLGRGQQLLKFLHGHLLQLMWQGIRSSRSSPFPRGRMVPRIPRVQKGMYSYSSPSSRALSWSSLLTIVNMPDGLGTLFSLEQNNFLLEHKLLPVHLTWLHLVYGKILFYARHPHLMVSEEYYTI